MKVTLSCVGISTNDMLDSGIKRYNFEISADCLGLIVLESSDQNWSAELQQSKAIRPTRFGRPDNTSFKKTHRAFIKEDKN